MAAEQRRILAYNREAFRKICYKFEKYEWIGDSSNRYEERDKMASDKR